MSWFKGFILVGLGIIILLVFNLKLEIQEAKVDILNEQVLWVEMVDRLQMYRADYNDSFLVNGLYHKDDDFYCVWTRNRSMCDIADLDPSLDCVNETALHELTHAMIDSDWDHFCITSPDILMIENLNKTKH